MKIEAPSGPVDGERMLFCAHADVDEDHIDISANACAHQPLHWYYVGPDNSVTKEPGGHQFPVQWVAICDECERAGLGVDAAAYDACWIGEPPNITADPSLSAPS